MPYTPNCPLSVKQASICELAVYEHGDDADDFDERFVLSRKPYSRTEWIMVRNESCSWTIHNSRDLRDVIARCAECTSLDQLARLMGFSDEEIAEGVDRAELAGCMGEW